MGTVPDEVLKQAVRGIYHSATAGSGAITPEQAILIQAGTIALQRRAGYMPAMTGTKPPESAAPDSSRRESDRAMMILTALMRFAAPQDIMMRFFHLLKRYNLRLPDEHLPALIDMGAKSVDLRPFITQHLNRRGHWLIAQQSENWLIAERNSHADVIADIKQMLQEAPHAINRLLRLWNQIPFSVQRKLLWDLCLEPDERYEPLLDYLLTHVHRLRSECAMVLSVIPGSQFQQDVLAHLRAYVHYDPRKHTLRLITPDDNRTVNNPVSGELMRTQFRTVPFLEDMAPSQLLRFVHPMVWAAEWNITPEQLLTALPTQGNERQTWLSQWIQALYYAQDGEFSAFLLKTLVWQRERTLPNLITLLTIIVRNRTLRVDDLLYLSEMVEDTAGFINSLERAINSAGQIDYAYHIILCQAHQQERLTDYLVKLLTPEQVSSLIVQLIESSISQEQDVSLKQVHRLLKYTDVFWQDQPGEAFIAIIPHLGAIHIYDLIGILSVCVLRMPLDQADRFMTQLWDHWQNGAFKFKYVNNNLPSADHVTLTGELNRIILESAGLLMVRHWMTDTLKSDKGLNHS